MDDASKRTERLLRARKLVSQGRFKGIEAETSSPKDDFGRGRGHNQRGRSAGPAGRGCNSRKRGTLPKMRRASAADTNFIAPSQDVSDSGEAPGKVWLPKSARALDISSSARPGSILEKPSAPVLILSGEET